MSDEALAAFFRTYAPADADWAFQLWLDAWAEAARRPAIQATSRRRLSRHQVGDICARD